MILKGYRIQEYVDPGGVSPFRTWIDSMPLSFRARIQARICRLESGNLGDFRSVGHGVFELRFADRPGHRLYFGFERASRIILLIGGSKGTQRRDITKARRNWIDYLGRGQHES